MSRMAQQQHWLSRLLGAKEKTPPNRMPVSEAEWKQIEPFAQLFQIPFIDEEIPRSRTDPAKELIPFRDIHSAFTDKFASLDL